MRAASGGLQLWLAALSPEKVVFQAMEGGDLVREVVVLVGPDGRPRFPTVATDATSSLGSEAADNRVRLCAMEEIVRMRGGRRDARRF